MKIIRMKLNVFILALSMATILFGSCRAKKPVAAQSAVEVIEEEKTAAPAPVVEKEVVIAPAPAAAKMPDFNYSNIQFEFNSAVLKTSSYALLDEIAKEMKNYPTVKFNTNGHSSREGSEQRNMTLSLDRANSVKTYLVNLGVDGSNITAVGFGESKPLNANNTEKDLALNRRVAIEKID